MQSEKLNLRLVSEKEEKQESHFDRLINNLVGYIDTQFKLIQLEVKEEIANAISILILVLVATSIAAFAGLLFSVAFAVYLGNILDSAVYGFSIVGGVYLVITGVIISQFKKIRASINLLINKKIKQIDIAKQEKIES